MKHLENENFKIGILSLGAELRSVINKNTNKEYIWQADEHVWPRSSPILFPFVGKLKDDTYTFRGKKYHLPQHGFARNFEFDVIEESSIRIVFQLSSKDATLIDYPFPFVLQLAYELKDNELSLEYKVKNMGDSEMYFSIGAHPAFNLSGDFENYTLEFEQSEKFERYLLKSGLRTMEKSELKMNENKLALKKEYFEEDAIVLKGMKSNSITILDQESNKLLSLHAENYPYYGIWSKSPYPFICLEPWEGIADHTNTQGVLDEKEGIIKLDSSEVFLRRIAFRFF